MEENVSNKNFCMLTYLPFKSCGRALRECSMCIPPISTTFGTRGRGPASKNANIHDAHVFIKL